MPSVCVCAFKRRRKKKRKTSKMQIGSRATNSTRATTGFFFFFLHNHNICRLFSLTFACTMAPKTTVHKTTSSTTSISQRCSKQRPRLCTSVFLPNNKMAPQEKKKRQRYYYFFFLPLRFILTDPTDDVTDHRASTYG